MKDNYIDSFLAQEFGKSQNYNEIKNGLFSEFNVKKVSEMKTAQE